MKNIFLTRTIFDHGYQSGQSLLHQLPVSQKWFFIFLFFICVSNGSIILLICLAGICLWGCWIASLSFKIFGQLLYSIRWFLAIIFICSLFFTPGLPIQTLDFIPFEISEEGFKEAFRSSLLIVDMFFMSTLFIKTTQPKQIFQSIKKLNFIKNPGGRAKTEAILNLGVWSFQLIPHICLEVERFMLDKLEKEKNESGWKGIKKAWQIALLLVPTLIHILRQNQKFSEIVSPTPVLKGK